VIIVSGKLLNAVNLETGKIPVLRLRDRLPQGMVNVERDFGWWDGQALPPRGCEIFDLF